MKKTVCLVFLLCITILILGIVYFRSDIDAKISGTLFFEALTTFTAVFGVFGFIYQMAESKELEEAQFLIDLNKLYFNNKIFENILNAVTEGHPESFQGDIKTEIVKYIDYFEPFYLILKNHAINMKTIDELFCFRFFALINSRYVQDTVLTPNHDFYHNIVRLHFIWKEYRTKNGRSVPFESSDLSLLPWYGEAFRSGKKKDASIQDLIPVEHIQIREATLDDVAAISELYKQLLGSTSVDVNLNNKFAEIQSEKNNHIFVATVNGSLVGSIQCTVCSSIAFNGRPHMALDYFVVDKDYRHKGIGTHLINYIKTLGEQMNVSCIYLVSSERLKKAHKFYKKSGFTNPVKGFRMVFR